VMKRNALFEKGKNPLVRSKASLTSSFYASRSALSRQEAVERVLKQVNRKQIKRKYREGLRAGSNVSLDEVGYLISLFQLQPEELSEAGLSFEQLKCLEKHFI
jgi:hypothetical protein